MVDKFDFYVSILILLITFQGFSGHFQIISSDLIFGPTVKGKDKLFVHTQTLRKIK